LKKVLNFEKISIGKYKGPETILIKDGNFIFGTSTGEIIIQDIKTSKQKIFVQTGGRPLSYKYDNEGNLIVVDIVMGLLSINKDGEIKILSTKTEEGKLLSYLDDISVSNSKFYFSLATTLRPIMKNNKWDPITPCKQEIISSLGSGALVMFDKETKKSNILINDLIFANGVALSRNEDFVLVAETGKYRILKYWLKGEKKRKYKHFF